MKVLLFQSEGMNVKYFLQQFIPTSLLRNTDLQSLDKIMRDEISKSIQKYAKRNVI